jgi:DNA polymerase
MFDVDFSAIEARISAWLANEEWKLEVFRTHGKIYEATVCRMTGMPLQEMLDYYKQNGKHHPDRFKGKVAELACIAEGQLVTTDHGMVPIEQVTLGMKVWDGFSFVSHQGVVYQGIREVLTYENLTATEDHIVFTEAGPMQFGKAARSNQLLSETRPSRDDVPRPSYRTRVYDILNCGPHNRFTVSGVLVHNCTYQGGVNALKAMGASDMGLKDEELQGIIDQWREANANIVKLWHACDRAAKSAVANVGSRHSVDKLEFFCAVTAGAKYLFMRLPSGRRLAYRDPKIEETISRDKKGKIETWDSGKIKTRQSLTYWGQIPGKVMWGRCAIYGGMWVENASQAIAADLLNNGTVNAEKRGIQVATLVHDQCLAYKRKDQKIEDLCECLTTLPAWADGLPIAVDGQVQPYYTK